MIIAFYQLSNVVYTKENMANIDTQNKSHNNSKGLSH